LFQHSEIERMLLEATRDTRYLQSIICRQPSPMSSFPLLLFFPFCLYLHSFFAPSLIFLSLVSSQLLTCIGGTSMNQSAFLWLGISPQLHIHSPVSLKSPPPPCPTTLNLSITPSTKNWKSIGTFISAPDSSRPRDEHPG